jgi:hypothetical protein
MGVRQNPMQSPMQPGGMMGVRQHPMQHPMQPLSGRGGKWQVKRFVPTTVKTQDRGEASQG